MPSDKQGQADQILQLAVAHLQAVEAEQAIYRLVGVNSPDNEALGLALNVLDRAVKSTLLELKNAVNRASE